MAQLQVLVLLSLVVVYTNANKATSIATSKTGKAIATSVAMSKGNGPAIAHAVATSDFNSGSIRGIAKKPGLVNKPNKKRKQKQEEEEEEEPPASKEDGDKGNDANDAKEGDDGGDGEGDYGGEEEEPQTTVRPRKKAKPPKARTGFLGSNRAAGPGSPMMMPNLFAAPRSAGGRKPGPGQGLHGSQFGSGPQQIWQNFGMPAGVQSFPAMQPLPGFGGANMMSANMNMMPANHMFGQPFQG